MIMFIVEESNIPQKEVIENVPLDDPIKVYNACLELQQLCEKEHGLGLSAVQAGVPWKLFTVRGTGRCPLIPKDAYGFFINCDYEAVDESHLISLEGCLSLRDKDGKLRSFQVERSSKIRVFGLILKVDESIKFEEFDKIIDYSEDGIVFQHEIDHSWGHDRLISKIGKEVFVW